MSDYAGVILLSPRNTVFLQQRDSKPHLINSGKIAIFGGTAHDGESPKNCAIREIKEEVDLNVTPDKLSLLNSYITNDQGKEVTSYIYIVRNVDKNKFTLHEGQAIVELNLTEDFNQANLTYVCRLALEDLSQKLTDFE